MEHHHNGCGHCCGQGCCGTQLPEVTKAEAVFLEKLAQTPFLEVAQLVMRSSKSEHFEAVALAPMHLESKADSMEKAKQMAQVLQSLAEKGIVEIDYDLPIENSDYALYKDSELYKYFMATLEEAGENPNFVFDIAHMEFGSIALTGLGQELL